MALNGAKINGNDAEQEAFKLCQEFLGAPWNTMDISNFRISIVKGGLSNKLYCCSLANDIIPNNPKVPKKVLLRIYGSLQDEEHRKVVEAATFVMLAEKNLGPKMYGIFPTGRLEEYIPSRILKQDDMRLMSTKTGRMLAKIHTLNIPVKKMPDLWGTQLKKWLQDVEKETLRRNKGKFPLKNFYSEEIQWLTKEMENASSPTVYCHNDLLGGNILIREDSENKEDPDITFIDFEFGGYNYRAYDIANHFSEWIYEYSTPDPPHFKLDLGKYPTKEERFTFIQAYTDQLVEEGVLKASDAESEINKIMKELKPFGMAAHLYWSLWCEKMKFDSDIGIFYEEYGKTRRAVYRSVKDIYIKKKSRNHSTNGYEKE